VDLVLGDSGFLSRVNCDLVAGVGGVAWFYPRRNSCLQQKGSKPGESCLKSWFWILRNGLKSIIGVLMWRVVFRL
jgi:hypothetical protein